MATLRVTLRRCCCLVLAVAALAATVSADADSLDAAPKQQQQSLQAPTSVAKSYAAAYHYVVCNADYVIEPTSTAEVVDAVKYYTKVAAAQGKTLKIRASRRKFHTTTNFACPQQERSLDSEAGPGVLTVGILHEKMIDVLAFDPKKLTMKVGAGMQLNHLLKAANDRKVSVLPGALPAYAGLTVGGIITGGAHGTGDKTWSNPCDAIVDFTWVDGKGNVHVTPRATEEGLALCSGLGLMGIITEVTFQFTPPTNTKLITRYLSDDANLVDDIEKMLKVSPHMLVFWRPDMKRYSAYMLKPVDISVPATTDKMNLLPSYKGMNSMASLFQQMQGDYFDNFFDLSGTQRAFMCPTVAYWTAAHTWASKQDGTKVLYTVAPTNSMVASECDDHCAWNGPEYNGTAEDVHFAIEWSQFRDWVNDFKNVIYKDLWETAYDKDRCLGPGYIWLRFGRNTTDYLTMSYNMTRPVYVQSTWLRSRGSNAPMRYNFVQELLEQMTLLKYHGRPHWGKNWPRTFTHPKLPVADLYPGFNKFLSIVGKYDPAKIYEPHLWTKVAKRQAYSYYPHCSLAKDCYCAEDAHCAKDHACVASKALPQFRVCKPDWRKAGRPRPTQPINENMVQQMIDFSRALPQFSSSSSGRSGAGANTN